MFYRQHKKLIICMGMLLMAVAAGFAGYRLARDEPRIAPAESAEDMAVDADDERIVRGASVLWHIDYQMCGHGVTIETTADEKMIGCSFSQFSESYPDVRILSFSSDRLELKKSFACYCPDHYVLKKHGDHLAVFRTAAGTGNQTVYLELPMAFEDTEKRLRPALETGRVFGSFEDLEAFLAKMRSQ